MRTAFSRLSRLAGPAALGILLLTSFVATAVAAPTRGRRSLVEDKDPQPAPNCALLGDDRVRRLMRQP